MDVNYYIINNKLNQSKKGNIIMNEFKEIMKTALVVTIIYIIAVLVSLILCDKLSDFKNSNNNQIRIINF